jgi:hypothetical protein
MLISEEEKTNAKKTFTCFLLTYALLHPLLLPIMIRVEETKENRMVDIKRNNFNNKYFKLTLMNHPYLRK